MNNLYRLRELDRGQYLFTLMDSQGQEGLYSKIIPLWEIEKLISTLESIGIPERVDSYKRTRSQIDSKEIKELVLTWVENGGQILVCESKYTRGAITLTKEELDNILEGIEI